MIVSDLNYLVSVEDNNIEGAGSAFFDELFSLAVNAQREAIANVSQIININADVYKTISFAKTVSVRAYV